MLRVAVLGAGRIGAVHAANAAAHADSQVVAIVDPKPDAAKNLAKSVGAEVSTVEQVLADRAIDAVVIATPTTMHADLIEQSIASSKWVFCEKPASLDVERIRSCIAHVGDAESRVLLGFNRRYDPDFHLIKTKIEDGGIGEVEMVSIISRDPAPPPITYIKRSGGLFRDMTIHDFDMARFLLGEEPVRVWASGACLVDPEIGEAGDIDSAVVMLQTTSGKICVITNSRHCASGYDQRIEVFGTTGTLSVGNHPDTHVTVGDAKGIHATRTQDFFIVRYAEAYKKEWDHFVAVTEGECAPLVTLHDAERALALAEAAEKSMASGSAETLVDSRLLFIPSK